MLAVGSAFWPILLAIDLVALRTSRPARVLASFLAGGLPTTIAVGLVIVFALDGTTLASSSHPTAGGWVNVAGGLAALLAAAALRARPVHPKTETSPSRIERLASGSAAYAVFAGVVLNLFPGVLPFFGLRNIAALETGNGVKVALIVVFYVIMFALIEVPLLGLLLAPQQVEPRVRRLNAWLDRNARLLEVRVLGIAGLFLLVRGAVQLAHG